jgi:hypothetical protein
MEVMKMFKLYALSLFAISGQLFGMQHDAKTRDAEEISLEELKRRSDASTQAFYDQVRAMKAEQGEEFDPNEVARQSAAEREKTSGLSREELLRRSNESTQAFLAMVKNMRKERGENAQEGDMKVQAEQKVDAESQEERKPALSAQQRKFIEDIQKQFDASKLKKELWDNIVKNLQREGMNNLSSDDLEDGFELFLEALGERIYDASRQATVDVQAELNRCKGKYVGGFFYSLYKPSWRLSIERFYRKKYLTDALLKQVSDQARAVGSKMPAACIVVDHIERELRKDTLCYFDKICADIEDLHKPAATKFARSIIRQRTRILVGFVAIAVITCGIYRHTRSEY